jgi:hypothetical protein
MADRRTGYYVAGRDWPAIPASIDTEELYRALERITDEDVAAALASLRGDDDG